MLRSLSSFSFTNLQLIYFTDLFHMVYLKQGYIKVREVDKIDGYTFPAPVVFQLSSSLALGLH